MPRRASCILLRAIIARWKWHLFSIFIEDEGHPIRMVLKLMHHRAVGEAANVLSLALHSRWCHLSDLSRIESRQALSDIDAIKFLYEVLASFWCSEVDKAIPNVALVLEVDGKIHEVEFTLEIFVQTIQKHLLCVFVGDIPQHDSGVILGTWCLDRFFFTTAAALAAACTNTANAATTIHRPLHILVSPHRPLHILVAIIERHVISSVSGWGAIASLRRLRPSDQWSFLSMYRG